MNQWKARLKRPNDPSAIARIAIVGVGHELHGDDEAGLRVVTELQARSIPNWVLILNGGHAPENSAGALRRFVPAHILFIDAAQMDEAPGMIRWLDWQDLTGISASTHTLPLHLLATYLREELGCEVSLLGIQPADTTLGAPLSEGVRQAIGEVVSAISEMLA